MRNKILVILALALIVGVSSAAADTWAGTGTGEWSWDTLHCHPFQTWRTNDDAELGVEFAGGFTDLHGTVGHFWIEEWTLSNTVGKGHWALLNGHSGGEGDIVLYFYGDSVTGKWDSDHYGIGSGLIYGSKL